MFCELVEASGDRVGVRRSSRHLRGTGLSLRWCALAAPLTRRAVTESTNGRHLSPTPSSGGCGQEEQKPFSRRRIVQVEAAAPRASHSAVAFGALDAAARARRTVVTRNGGD